MARARLVGQVVALSVVATLLALLVWRLTHQPSPPKIGRPAPAFSLARLNGNGKLSLASLRGKAVVINFFASWCGPCKQEAPALERLWQTYRAKGVAFVGIDSNDARSDGLRFLRAHGITYPAVHDARGLVAANKYDVANMPTTFFVDRAGRLVGSAILGPVNEKHRSRDFADALKVAMAS